MQYHPRHPQERPRCCAFKEIRNNEVVKIAEQPEVGPAVAGRHGLSDATARVARALLVEGALTAGELASRLLLTGTAVRRHLDTLIDGGYAEANEERPFGPTPRRGVAGLRATTR